MKILATVLVVISTAAPAYSQGLPALEGEGTQTQSLELAKGAASINVESSGGLSLGRGADTLHGSLGVSINDVGIGIGNGGESAQSPGTTTGAAAGVGPDPGQRTATGLAQDDNRATLAGAGCNGGAASLEDLRSALDREFPIFLRAVECPTAVPGTAQMLADQPDFSRKISQAGIAADAVVSITIHNGSVIVDHH